MRRPDVDVDRLMYPVIVGRSYSTPGAEATEANLRERVRAAVTEYLTLTGEDTETAECAAALAVADRLRQRGINVVTLTREQLAHYSTRATQETSS